MDDSLLFNFNDDVNMPTSPVDETTCMNGQKSDDEKTTLSFRLSPEHSRAVKTVAFLSGYTMSILIEKELDTVLASGKTALKKKKETLKLPKEYRRTSLSISKATYKRLKLFSFEKNLSIQFLIDMAFERINYQYKKMQGA